MNKYLAGILNFFGRIILKTTLKLASAVIQIFSFVKTMVKSPIEGKM
jgi:hypothetical protein